MEKEAPREEEEIVEIPPPQSQPTQAPGKEPITYSRRVTRAMERQNQDEQKKEQAFANVEKRQRTKFSSTKTLEIHEHQQILYDYIESLEAKGKEQ